jgi:hypothetical protein
MKKLLLLAVLGFVLAAGVAATVLTVTPQAAVAEPCAGGSC